MWAECAAQPYVTAPCARPIAREKPILKKKKGTKQTDDAEREEPVPPTRPNNIDNNNNKDSVSLITHTIS